MTRKVLARHAFSLIELVCVIAIIGILTAIALPAIQDLRELARRLTCANHLRQLGFAMQMHEGTHRALPIGTLGTDRTLVFQSADSPDFRFDPNAEYYIHDYQNTSWLLPLLPLLERNDLAMQIPSICSASGLTYREYRRRNPSAPPRLIDDLEVQAVLADPLEVLLCPTDNLLEESFSENLLGSQPAYIVPFTEGRFGTFPYRGEAAGTNYVACAGAGTGAWNPNSQVTRYDGAFGSRTPVRLAAVRDGTSQTIAVGENLGQIEKYVRTRANSWMFATLARGRSEIPWRQSRSVVKPDLELLGDSFSAYPVGFASRHFAGVQFLYVDGSVHNLSRSIEVEVLYRLCGKSDGGT